MFPIKIKVVAVDPGTGVSKKTGQPYAIPKVTFTLVGGEDGREKELNLVRDGQLAAFPVGSTIEAKLVLEKGQWGSVAKLSK